MLKFINPKIEILENKIKDLERALTQIESENSFLKNELVRERSERSELQDKIFDLTGVNRREINKIERAGQPVKVETNHLRTWADQRRKLEMESQEAYWLRKKAEEEAKLRTEKLESELEISNASEVS